jgi:hypothetical protein
MVRVHKWHRQPASQLATHSGLARTGQSDESDHGLLSWYGEADWRDGAGTTRRRHIHTHNGGS